MGAKETFSKISYFFECYLYQCALEEFGSIEGVVAEFIAREELNSIRVLSEEFNAFQETPTRQLLRDFGSWYAPKTDEEASSWFVRIHAMLHKHLDNPE